MALFCTLAMTFGFRSLVMNDINEKDIDKPYGFAEIKLYKGDWRLIIGTWPNVTIFGLNLNWWQRFWLRFMGFRVEASDE